MIMIKELSTVFPAEYLHRVWKRTGVKPSIVDAFFKWLISGLTKTDDKMFLVMFKEIRKKIPDWFFPPPKYPLYRDIEVGPQAIHDLQEKTLPIKLKPRVLTSWKESFATVNELIAQEPASKKVGLCVQGSPKRVVCIVTKKLVDYMDIDGKLAGLTRDLDEVIVSGNGIDHIIPQSIKTLNYQGKSTTLDKFQSIFKIDEKEFKISYDAIIQKYLFGVRVHKITKQPIDGKSFIYLVKNATDKTILEVVDKLEQHGFKAGKLGVSKKGKKIALVHTTEKLGITLEENLTVRFIRVTLFPMSNV